MFAVVSVVEKALIEVKPRLRVTQYVLDESFLIATNAILNSNFFYFIGVLRTYPWQANPSIVTLLSGLLLIPLSYGYFSKTFVSFVERQRAVRKGLSCFRDVNGDFQSLLL